jgi:heterodisulfide reductase subunit C2
MIDMEFVNRINAASGQTVQLCYHCHKCTSGCLVADEMTYGPDRVLRLIQLGRKEELLASHDIWLCASCETCGTRCPNDIDIAQVMDALRQMAVAEGAPIAEPDAIKFHRLFLALLQRMGRMHEATLLSIYLLWTRSIFSYVGTGSKMFIKGKVPLIPQPIKGRKELARIFKETKR